MIDVVNLQRKVRLNTDLVQKFSASLVTAIPEMDSRPFSVAFISDRRMKQLNHLFRGKDSTTDVLSFQNEPDEFDPNSTSLGDIVISAEQAQKQAAENGLSLENEIKQLILHGLLHLCGYDHEADSGEMNARELGLREQLEI